MTTLILFVATVAQAPIALVDGNTVFAEKDGLVAVEAEHFFKQTATEQRAFHLTTSDVTPDIQPDGDPPHVDGASGKAYLEILPDTRRTHGDKLIQGENFSPQPGKMAVLHYKVRFTTPGRYYVWVRAHSTGSEDNGLHVGIDGAWPESGQRLQWCAGKRTWRWESKQRTHKVHCGEPHKVYLDVKQAGEHVIHFSMREDGFEFDKWLMTTDRDFARPADAGPQPVVHAGERANRKPAKPTSPAATGQSFVALQQRADKPEATKVSGELKKWHKVTIDFEGPETSETATPNPFTDYRLDVTFRHGDTTYVAPGYYAADGDAANTSAADGNVWRVHFCPDKAGKWTYEASFKKGPHVATEGGGQSAAFFDGASGTFEIQPTDKAGRDHRGKGRLQYVGERYLKFAETGEYFLKQGADAPENLFAYQDFDGDFKNDGEADNRIKSFRPHLRDWKQGDPTWKDGKGKGLIGALNYLASEGLNAFSFLPLNIDGDDKNVFPYLDYDERYRMDVSRLAQWEVVFEHADRLGMFIHFKTLETENELLLDRGDLGPQRKLYYRELIARFGHHLAMNWNLGEEINNATTAQKKSWAQYFYDHDPYHHLIVIHNGANHFDLMGKGSKLTGFSLQTNKPDFSNVHGQVRTYLQKSAAAGKQWAVACDEPGDATHSLRPDNDAGNSHEDGRRNGLWGTLMAGGWGNEWYFGYKHAHSDLTLEDFRSRDRWWDYCRYALEFFDKHEIPFWEMASRDDLTPTAGAYCFCKPGEVYVVYLKQGGAAKLDLSQGEGRFEVHWYDPRHGGALQTGSVATVAGGAVRSLGSPPKDAKADWVVLVRPADPKRNYAPAVSAGADQSLMLPRDGKPVTTRLRGDVRDDGKPGGQRVESNWSVQGEPRGIKLQSADQVNTTAVLSEPGVYVLQLSASDGERSAADTVTITVEPFSARVTKTYSPVEDAYVEGSLAHDNQHLKVEPNRRVSYLKFDVRGLPSKILRASLKLTENGDTGAGTLQVHAGAHSDWTAERLAAKTAPAAKDLVAKQQAQVGGGQTIEFDVTRLITGNGTFTAVLSLADGGNDVWFGSSDSSHTPQLIVTAEDPDSP